VRTYRVRRGTAPERGDTRNVDDTEAGRRPGSAGVDRRTLAALGEFGLIAAVTAGLPQGDGVLLGPGDDAAVVAAPDGRVVVTTDLLVAGRHFRCDWSSAYDVGRKAAAQNLADIAAMGAVPTSIVVGLAAPSDLDVAWAQGLADGLRDECALVGASVVGGDMAGSDVLMVAVTALGDLGGRAPVTRGGARPGDVVAVAGRLGASAAGLALLAAARGEAAEWAGLVAAHRRPGPPYAAGPAAAALGATALIDVSDGLLADLRHVATASGVAVDLVGAALAPDAELTAAAAAVGVDARGWVLTGGEDHALVGCFPAGTSLPAPWRVVGAVTRGSGVTVDGAPWAGPAGWEHFA
jgi:thiamine-monophosphate kinase